MTSQTPPFERAEKASLFGHTPPSALSEVAQAYLVARQRRAKAEEDLRAAKDALQQAERELLTSLSAHEQSNVEVGNVLITAASLTSYGTVADGLDNAFLLRWIRRSGGWNLLKTTLDAHGFSALCRKVVAEGGELPYLVRSYQRTVIQVRSKGA